MSEVRNQPRTNYKTKIEKNVMVPMRDESTCSN